MATSKNLDTTAGETEMETAWTLLVLFLLLGNCLVTAHWAVTEKKFIFKVMAFTCLTVVTVSGMAVAWIICH
jgi:hypothetical protein